MHPIPDGATRFEKVCILAKWALENFREQGRERASARELLNHIEANAPLHAADVRNVWAVYLSRAANTPQSGIVREPGRYGYMLSPPAQLQPGDREAVAEETHVPGAEVARAPRERHLYSALQEWLRAKGYLASDTSRSRGGGAWGNPDVIGIRMSELVARGLHFELVSIEVKLSQQDWKRSIFEAIAHKRFADRAYFAFGCPADEVVVSSLPDFLEMREYGERYGVGILAVFVKPNDYDMLRRGNANELENFSLEESRIEEIWPAIYHPAPPALQDQYLREVLGVNSLQDLFSFGFNIEEE